MAASGTLSACRRTNAGIERNGLRSWTPTEFEPLSRGLFVLALQLFVCAAVTALGVWALLWPKRLQRFLNRNYALLPEVREGWQPTQVLLRLIGLFLIWYGGTLAASYQDELLWLARVFDIIRPSPPA